jgi:FlaA1/EpsC-like NDP-sugar epimerase
MLTYRKLLILALQAVLATLTYYVSFLLRLDFHLDASMRQVFFGTLGLVIVARVVMMWAFGLVRGWWRYVGISDLQEIAKACFASSLLIYLGVTYSLHTVGFPRSVFAIDLLLSFLATAGVRVLVRSYTDNVKSCVARRNTLVVGAGLAGTEMVRHLKQNPNLDYCPVGFVDDDPSKKGIRIHGVPVLGSRDQIASFISRYRVKCVLVAMPSAGGKIVDEIIGICRTAAVEFKIAQPSEARLNGNTPQAKLRNIRIEDLLNRDPVRLELETISRKFKDKVLLVTGGGGSIGSELCRQLARFQPKQLVICERSESDLFDITHELNESFPALDCKPVVADILDVGALRDTFALYRPSSVFHAAAYKHVPMMEMHCFQAITNNVFGTYNVALVSRQYEVDDFVLISTDKAVKPTNIMGATKRIAELIILGLQQASTRFVAVRFGNVLGSNGSAVPIFERQIAKGGPVCVTHPDALRYFMTIPEAAQLVLQASTMGRGGEIFVLRMGEPVRILDLAEKLIRLSGFEPNREIKIKITGLRPGEKLREELQLEGEGVLPTSHEKVCVLSGGEVDFRQVRAWLNDLARITTHKNVAALVAKIREIVPEYQPSPEMLALCEVDQHDLVVRYRDEGNAYAADAAA